MTTDARFRVILIPVNGRARVEWVDRRQSRQQMEKLIFADTFSVVTVWATADGESSVQLYVDDDGVARGKAPHFWARGAILHGPVLITKTKAGEEVDFSEEELGGLLCQAQGLGFPWQHERCLRLFAPIPPAELEEALAESERMRAEGMARLRQRLALMGENAPFVAVLPSPALMPKACVCGSTPNPSCPADWHGGSRG